MSKLIVVSAPSGGGKTSLIKALLEEEEVYARMYEGEKYDCGSKKGFVHATIALALKDKSISKDIKKIIKEII